MRIKPGVAKHRRLKRILKEVKGYRGARGRRIKLAKEAIVRAGANAYRDRRLKKREYRALWITRLNAATRQHGLRYSEFIHGLKLANIELDRKTLSEMAIHDPDSFKQLVEKAQAAL